MIEQLPSDSVQVLGFKLSGKLHDADYKTFVPAIDAAAAKQDQSAVAGPVPRLSRLGPRGSMGRHQVLDDSLHED